LANRIRHWLASLPKNYLLKRAKKKEGEHFKLSLEIADFRRIG
jgi:hypothetical protein